MDWSIAKTLGANFVLSVCAGVSAHHFMKQFIPLFIQRKLYGLDQCKVGNECLFYFYFSNLRWIRNRSPNRWAWWPRLYI